MLTLLLQLLTPTAHACLWASDTLATEQAGMPDITAVITGRFDRHPPAYYAHRLDLARRLMADTPSQLSTYDDAAVALDLRVVARLARRVALALQVDEMTHAVDLRAQVADVLRIGRRVRGHALDDPQPVAGEPRELLRVVGHEAHVGDA